MTEHELTAALAERLLGWRAAPGRFLQGGRRWIPAWRFRPTERLEDACRLLDAAHASESNVIERNGIYFVRLFINGGSTEASERSRARAITYAVARAFGIEPTSRPSPKTGADRI